MLIYASRLLSARFKFKDSGFVVFFDLDSTTGRFFRVFSEPNGVLRAFGSKTQDLVLEKVNLLSKHIYFDFKSHKNLLSHCF